MEPESARMMKRIFLFDRFDPTVCREDRGVDGPRSRFCKTTNAGMRYRRAQPRSNSVAASSVGSGYQPAVGMSAVSVAHATKWNGSAQRIAAGQYRVTTDAIHPAASEVTWVSFDLLGPEQVEEPGQSGGSRPGASHTRRRSRDRRRRSILVPLLIRDFVDPDPPKPGQRVPCGGGVRPHPLHDRPDRAPRGAHQLAGSPPFQVCVASHATVWSKVRV